MTRSSGRSSSSMRTKFEPMKPAPPVTRMVRVIRSLRRDSEQGVAPGREGRATKFGELEQSRTLYAGRLAGRGNSSVEQADADPSIPLASIVATARSYQEHSSQAARYTPASPRSRTSHRVGASCGSRWASPPGPTRPRGGRAPARGAASCRGGLPAARRAIGCARCARPPDGPREPDVHRRAWCRRRPTPGTSGGPPVGLGAGPVEHEVRGDHHERSAGAGRRASEDAAGITVHGLGRPPSSALSTAVYAAVGSRRGSDPRPRRAPTGPAPRR